MLNENELLRLSKQIKAAESTVAELNGSKKQLLKQLQTTWDCESVKEATKKVELMETQIAKQTESIKTQKIALQEKLNAFDDE